MLAKVADFLTRYSTHAGGKLGVAVSGGADSVCLLTILRELGLRPHVLHLNHHLRGLESDADEQFVRELAAGLPFHSEHADLNGVKGNLEQAAREARREFFTRLLDRKVVGAVALAHTRDDQAETVLMRLIRGTGSRGLAAMRPVSGRFLRPLLGSSRAEVEAFLRERGIAWREDQSNRDPRFTRNRIRHELLPLLERDYNPGVREALAHLAATAADEEDYWYAEVEKLAVLSLSGNAAILDAAEASKLHPAMLRRLIRRAVEVAKGDLRQLSFEHVESIATLVTAKTGSGKVRIPGLMVVRSFGQVRLGPIETPMKPFCLAARPGETFDPPGIVLETVEPGGRVKVKEDLAWNRLTHELVTGLVLRSWEPGDAYRPKGETRRKKLKELFQRARVPVWERDGWPVLAIGGRILWSRGFGPAARFAASVRCERVLRVRELAVSRKDGITPLGSL